MNKIIAIVLIYISIGSVSAYNRFYYGHCTWYVANNINVTWGGHAKSWYSNASSIGVDTGQVPRYKSIIVFDGPGYNEEYGHVGIVENRIGDVLIISEMNYKRLGQITYRRVDIGDTNIIGYIYK